MNPTPIHIISLGAGVQSSTMALMAAAGEITPMPEFAVFSDTGDEPVAVYNWLRILTEMLPFPVHIATNSLGKLSDNLILSDHSQIPAFMSGTIGKRQCTEHWKLRPIRKTIRGIVGNTPAIQWIGISTDEISRVKDSNVQWLKNRHPLIELRMSRQDCLQWLQARNISGVPKSACTYCPYHSDAQWRGFKQANGKEWAQIQSVDKLLNARGEFLHSSCKPLSEVDFSNEEERGQLNMFNNECEGMCNT